MDGYKYLEHTADAKFEAFGQTYEELFENCAYAVENLVVDTSKVEPTVLKKINVASNDVNSLLYDFLEEIIFLIDAELFLVSKVSIVEMDLEENTLFAKVFGEEIDSSKHELKNNLKAVTYNEMKVEKTDSGYKATVVIDL
ncbi:archease [Candidatus Woesearchaeota archaeon]|nr:archease [Candidatus Woesearchaeota archaeon]